MLTRRYFAFRSNVQRLGGAYLSLWTFTLVDVVEPKEFTKAWNRLLTYLKRHQPKWSGVRVYELHPGKWGEFSHGLHVHVVTNKFFDLTWVLKIAKSAGWGRIHWQPLTRPESAEYIGKYLNKKRPGALKGMRLQATFGMRFTRLRDIEIQSTRARLFRSAPEMAFPDGRKWIERNWMEKLQLVARLEWEVVARGLEWCDTRRAFASDPFDPDRLAALRERCDAVYDDPNPTPPGWVPPPPPDLTPEQWRGLWDYESAIAGEGPWTVAAKKHKIGLATLVS